MAMRKRRALRAGFRAEIIIGSLDWGMKYE